MMNSLNLTLSKKHFICPSILNDSFAGYSNLRCRSLPFMTWNTSFQPLLACKVSFEKSADSLMGIPLQVTVSFVFNLFVFNLGQCDYDVPSCVPLWVQLLWDSLGFLNFLEFISFTRLRKFSFIICSNKFSISWSSSSPSGTPVIQVL